MRNILAFLRNATVIFFLSLPLFAGGGGGDANIWDRRGISPFFPMIQIKGIFISIDGLCVDGDEIRPFKPCREVCVERHHGEAGDCILYEKIYVSKPRSYSVVECVERESNDRGDCVRHEMFNRIIPLTWDVEIYDNCYPGECKREPLGIEKFTIPDCS